MTPLKPISIASRIASVALSTEAQPLMPHAHGINVGSLWRVAVRPSGNGMPMANANGAASSIAAAILAGSDMAMIASVIVGNAKT